MTYTDADAAGTAYWFLDTLAVVHSATPPLVIEATIPAGGSPPLHVHDDLDDCSYLLDGMLAVRCGERTFRAEPGAYLPQPRGVPHTFRVLGSRPARMLLIHGDDSFLRLVRSLGVPAPSRALPSGMAPVAIETLERALREVGVSVVGPSMTAAEAAARPGRGCSFRWDSVCMRVGILGPLEVDADGRVAEIAGVRLRALLIRLALDAGRVVTVESLSQALWPEEMPGDPAHAVQSLVSRLRQALPGGTALRSSSGGYRLDLPPEAVDAARFERLAHEGGRALRNGEAETAAQWLREALGLWRGEPLADVAEAPFAAPVIVRLTELRLAVIEDRVAADLDASASRAHLVAELEELTSAHPLRERLRLLLVKALHADGRPAEALAAYEAFRGLLADQLGTDPGPELQDAHLAVLRGERASRGRAEGVRVATSGRRCPASSAGRRSRRGWAGS